MSRTRLGLQQPSTRYAQHNLATDWLLTVHAVNKPLHLGHDASACVVAVRLGRAARVRLENKTGKRGVDSEGGCV